MATVKVEKQSSIVSDISFWEGRNPFLVSEHIHEKESHRHRREVTTEPQNGGQRTIRDVSASSQFVPIESLTSKATHRTCRKRKDSRSIFLLYKQRKQLLIKSKKTSRDFSESVHDYTVLETEATAPISPIDASKGKRIGFHRKMKLRLKPINRNEGLINGEAEGQNKAQGKDPVPIVLSHSFNPQGHNYRGESVRCSFDFGLSLKQDAKQSYQQSVVKALISECNETESVGKQELLAISKSKQTESKLLNRFLETVKCLQDLDLYQTNVLPKVYNEKVSDEVFRSIEAKEVARDYHLDMMNPERPVARIERGLRRRKKSTEQ